MANLLPYFLDNHVSFYIFNFFPPPPIPLNISLACMGPICFINCIVKDKTTVKNVSFSVAMISLTWKKKNFTSNFFGVSQFSVDLIYSPLLSKQYVALWDIATVCRALYKFLKEKYSLQFWEHNNYGN